MIFTMRFTAHPDRRTAFEVRMNELGRIHMLIERGCPWQNAFIERSNRTDNEACFHQIRFANAEDRRYQFRLWEMYYAANRPHQGLQGRTPFEVYQQNYRLHAATRMLI
jgi:hypothetical protein